MHYFLNNSTIHGVPRFFTSKNPVITSTWILLTLISFSAGIFFIGNTLEEFLKYHLTTDTKIIETDLVYFPAITFCILQYNISDYFYSAAFLTTYPKSVSKITDFEYFLNDQFSCMTFNNNKANRSLLRGDHIFDNFYMEFYTFPSSYNNGIFVYINDNYSNSIKKSPNIETIKLNRHIIYLKKSVEKKVPYPYNPCQDIEDKTYRFSNCIEQCINNHSATIYNCTHKGYYSIPDFKYCTSDWEFYTKEFKGMCKQECPVECESTKFDMTISQISYKPYAVFNVYYYDLSYVEIAQHKKMDSILLTNNIGGALSLFIGISFLSTVEIIEFIIEILHIFLTR